MTFVSSAPCLPSWSSLLQTEVIKHHTRPYCSVDGIPNVGLKRLALIGQISCSGKATILLPRVRLRPFTFYRPTGTERPAQALLYAML